VESGVAKFAEQSIAACVRSFLCLAASTVNGIGSDHGL
jgi:hypothetical protein